MVQGLEVAQLANDVTVASFGQVVIIQCRGLAPASMIPPSRRARDTVLRRHAGFVFFAVIEAESVPPDDAARKAALQFFEESGASLSAVVFASKAGGFRGAMIRAVLSSIFDLLPKKRLAAPRHVAATVEAAAELAKPYAAGLDPTALVAAYEELARMVPAP